MGNCFPDLVSYNRFVELQRQVVQPLAVYLKIFGLGKCSGIFFIDSTALKVCHYKREKQHKVFKDIAEKSYAYYKSKNEDEIVKQLIKNDGGKENLQLVNPKKLGIWETILNKSYYSTWIFMNWEGVLAKSHTDELRYFKLKDYNIPYSYSTIIATNGNAINSSIKVYKDFLSATKKGYLYCKENPEEACKILYDKLLEYDKEIDLKEALSKTVTAFGTENNWGIMDENIVLDFLNWLKKIN